MSDPYNTFVKSVIPPHKATFETLVDVDDETIAGILPYKLSEALEYVETNLSDKGLPRLRNCDLWMRVFKRAYQIVYRKAVEGQKKSRFRQRPSNYLIDLAALVADDHVRQFGASAIEQQSTTWPTAEDLMKAWGIDIFQLRASHQQALTHKWKHRYIVEDSKETQAAILRRAAMQDVEESRGGLLRDRPGVLKAAAEILGLNPRKTEVHIGNRNTVNVMLPPAQDFEDRMRRVREVAAKVLPQEVTREGTLDEVVDEAEAVPRGEGDRPPEAGETAAG